MDCPMRRAIRTAIAPATRNRMAEIVRGGAFVTMIRAEVKAEDHMKANASPPKIALMSMSASLTSGTA